VLGLQLKRMIFEVFSNLIDSVKASVIFVPVSFTLCLLTLLAKIFRLPGVGIVHYEELVN